MEAMLSAAVFNAGTALTTPPQSALARLLERLLWLLGLSEGERRFVTALAGDAADFATLGVFADWLEEAGRTADGARVRRLVPRDGDVLVLRYPPESYSSQGVQESAAAMARDLRARGLNVDVAVLADDSDLSALDSDAMRAAGWVRAEDVLARAGALQAYLKDRWGSAAERAVARHFQNIFDPSAPEAPP
jgi:hypothetical protein